MPKPTIIAVANPKGGCGKSSLAWGLCSALSEKYRVLAVDADPQGSLTQALCAKPGAGTYEVLLRDLAANAAATQALPAYGAQLFVVAATQELVGVEAETAGRLDRHYLFAEALGNLQGWDFLIIDTPAGQSVLSTGAMIAADFCLTPASTDDACFLTLPAFKATVELVQRRLNSRLVWLPLVASLVARHQVMDRAVHEAMRTAYPVFDTAIPRRVKVREEMAVKVPSSLPEMFTLTHEITKEMIRHAKEVPTCTPG